MDKTTQNLYFPKLVIGLEVWVEMYLEFKKLKN